MDAIAPSTAKSGLTGLLRGDDLLHRTMLRSMLIGSRNDRRHGDRAASLLDRLDRALRRAGDSEAQLRLQLTLGEQAVDGFLHVGTDVEGREVGGRVSRAGVRRGERARVEDLCGDADLVTEEQFALRQLRGDHLGVDPRSRDATEGIIVVVESGSDARCLFVDELLGKQEVVIKNLGDLFVAQRDFAGHVMHIAQVNMMLLATIGGKTPAPQINMKATSKADTIKAMSDTFDYGTALIKEQTDQTMVAGVQGPPWMGVSTRARMIAFLIGHTQDTYGQMVVYLRLNGVAPPASQRP